MCSYSGGSLGTIATSAESRLYLIRRQNGTFGFAPPGGYV